jgi:replicative DNA helicase
VREVSESSRQLNKMAKELRTPVLVLSQLNRGCEVRENKRPRLSDLRASGQIEQDADVAILLYRDYIYNRSSDKYKLEICVAKNRDGEVATALLNFYGDRKKVDDALDF